MAPLDPDRTWQPTGFRRSPGPGALVGEQLRGRVEVRRRDVPHDRGRFDDDQVRVRAGLVPLRLGDDG
jgi:hypothetical protein